MLPQTLRPFVIALALAAVVVTASPATAGPPLLCHPFDIGNARSLPWEGKTSWSQGKADYDIANLVSDTETLLSPATPVIVRMETLRRAAIYASREQAVAGALVKRLGDRTHADGNVALAYLDLAYVAGAFEQISAIGGRVSEFRGRDAYLRPLVQKLSAYALVSKSLALRPGDPSLEFAAALITADTNRTAYELHARRARERAESDALLLKNIGQIAQ